jgi:hypothetical protein
MIGVQRVVPELLRRNLGLGRSREKELVGPGHNDQEPASELVTAFADEVAGPDRNAAASRAAASCYSR